MKTNGSTHSLNPPTSAPEKKPHSNVPPELQHIIRSIRARSSDYIIRRKQLKAVCGRAVSTTHVDIANGVFPPAFAIGIRAQGFSANEIDAWIAARLFASRSKTPVDMRAFISLLVLSRIQAI